MGGTLCGVLLIGNPPAAQEAYRAAVLQRHPDKARAASRGSGTEGLETPLRVSSNAEPEPQFLQLQRAWEVLRVREERAAYDRHLAAGAPGQLCTASASRATAASRQMRRGSSGFSANSAADSSWPTEQQRCVLDDPDVMADLGPCSGRAMKTGKSRSTSKPPCVFSALLCSPGARAVCRISYCGPHTFCGSFIHWRCRDMQKCVCLCRNGTIKMAYASAQSVAACDTRCVHVKWMLITGRGPSNWLQVARTRHLSCLCAGFSLFGKSVGVSGQNRSASQALGCVRC